MYRSSLGSLSGTTLFGSSLGDDTSDTGDTVGGGTSADLSTPNPILAFVDPTGGLSDPNSHNGICADGYSRNWTSGVCEPNAPAPTTVASNYLANTPCTYQGRASTTDATGTCLPVTGPAPNVTPSPAITPAYVAPPVPPPTPVPAAQAGISPWLIAGGLAIVALGAYFYFETDSAPAAAAA